jgi:hypothetical protein
MSLIEHAKREMQLAGLYDKDADYGGMIPEAVMALVEAHSKQGHSGGSHHLVLEIFNRVINFKTLTPIGSTKDEWFKHDYQVAGENCWQNTRQGSIFSQDGGQTWYDLDDPEKKNFPKHLQGND